MWPETIVALERCQVWMEKSGDGRLRPQAFLTPDAAVADGAAEQFVDADEASFEAVDVVLNILLDDRRSRFCADPFDSDHVQNLLPPHSEVSELLNEILG